MAVPEGKTRFTITLSNDVLDVIDAEREKTGKTRSEVIASAVVGMYDVADLQSMTSEQVVAFLETLLAQERRKLDS